MFVGMHCVQVADVFQFCKETCPGPACIFLASSRFVACQDSLHIFGLEAAKNALYTASLHILGSLQIFGMPRIWRLPKMCCILWPPSTFLAASRFLARQEYAGTLWVSNIYVTQIPYHVRMQLCRKISHQPLPSWYTVPW